MSFCERELPKTPSAPNESPECFETCPPNSKISLRQAVALFIHLVGWTESLTIALTHHLLHCPGCWEPSPVSLASLGTFPVGHITSYAACTSFSSFQPFVLDQNPSDSPKSCFRGSVPPPFHRDHLQGTKSHRDWGHHTSLPHPTPLLLHAGLAAASQSLNIPTDFPTLTAGSTGNTFHTP